MTTSYQPPIRTRFAPSPTGFLHIGNARAALINWLFVRHATLAGHPAEFMLRLDDTDQERSTEEYAIAIAHDLNWLGLTHDLFARQSDRFERYHEAVQQLIADGRLYPCYETREELEFKRKRLLGRGQAPIYDRAALTLTDAEKQALEAEGRQPHWRFRLEDAPIVWHDLVRGEVHFEGRHLSDPVLVRADGAFLYTLTSVVDDIDFAITHILRGEDHVTNTAAQVQLFQALQSAEQTLPTFGHTTLLLDTDGAPLSKRLGSLSLHALRDAGIEPMAINALLSRLGTSLPIETQIDLDALARDFSLESFSRTPPRFDMDDLLNLNHRLFQITPYSHIQERLTTLAPHFTEQAWELIRSNIHKFEDCQEWEHVLFGDVPTRTDEPEYIQIALTHLPSSPWNVHTWSQWTEHLKALTQRTGKNLYMPLRQAITGHTHGPEMKTLLVVMGYERVHQRLTQCLAH